MALIGTSEAAKLSGKNRVTIQRAMKTGRLSYTMNDAGERRIDTAELDRVFGAAGADSSKSNTEHAAVLHAQLDAERRANALLERTNDDLRQRLDTSESERRSVQTQLTALLAHQREEPPPPPPPSGPTGVRWPRRVLGWLVKQHR
jgi:hypothetical protein